jgi:hypothetical protein
MPGGLLGHVRRWLVVDNHSPSPLQRNVGGESKETTKGRAQSPCRRLVTSGTSSFVQGARFFLSFLASSRTRFFLARARVSFFVLAHALLISFFIACLAHVPRVCLFLSCSLTRARLSIFSCFLVRAFLSLLPFFLSCSLTSAFLSFFTAFLAHVRVSFFLFLLPGFLSFLLPCVRVSFLTAFLPFLLACVRVSVFTAFLTHSRTRFFLLRKI